MLSPKSDRYPDGRISVYVAVSVHQTVVTTGTTDLEWEEALVCLHIHSVDANPGFVDDIADLLLSDVGEIMTVNNDNRSEGTSAEAIYCLQCNVLFYGCLASTDAQLALKLVCDPLPPSDVAGRA